jgi:hypothetical protein
MKITQEALTCILNDKDELVAVTRRNGHVVTYLAKEVNSDQHTKLLEEIAKK